MIKVQEQLERIDVKGTEEESAKNRGKHERGLNTSDWELKREFSRREGLKADE